MADIFDRARRLELELSIEVCGEDASGGRFRETSTTINISSGAVCFESARRIEIGASLDLEIALPEALRYHFGGEAVYRTRAVVYRVEPAAPHRIRVVARFVGGATPAAAGS